MGGPAPPRPGIQVDTTDETVFVQYEFPKGIARCRPAILVIALANSDGSAPSIATPHRITKLSDVLELPVPKNFRHPPDTISVSALTADGNASPRARVRPR
jgi:hypothetical protein